MTGGAGEGSTAAGDGSDTDDGSPWTTRWYRSGLGLGLLGANVVLLLLVVTVSAPPAGNLAVPGSYREATAGTLPAVPWFVYVFGAIGGVGYVFTWLFAEFERSVKSLVRVSLRVPAALPLSAGVYVVAAQVNGGSLPPRFGAALAFLAGLYVNLAYRRLGALADRLLPGEESDGDSESTGNDETSTAGEPPLTGSEDGSDERERAGEGGEDAMDDERSSLAHSPPVRNERSSDGAE